MTDYGKGAHYIVNDLPPVCQHGDDEPCDCQPMVVWDESVMDRDLEIIQRFTVPEGEDVDEWLARIENDDKEEA